MWMVGCSDHGNNKEMKIPPPSDPAYARKLRPLMPRPISSCTNKTTTLFSTTSTTPCFCCIHNPNIISWNHSLGGGGGSGEYGGIRREMTNMPLVSTRWNPMPEQLQALEEMYRRGTRTPSAEQIQQIAVKLRKFGKIEGKNVFYWFQNHKARERQKKRRQLELQSGKKLRDVETTETKPSGLNKRFLQIEQPKKLPTLSNCTTTPPEDSASMHGTVVSEFKRDGWTELNQKEFHNQIITTKNQNCFWKLDLSSCNDTVTQADNNSINLINNYSAGQENIASPFGAMFPPKNEILEIRENQTLQLFPIRSNDDLVMSNIATLINIASEEEETQEDVSKPKEFIEFLPTKI